MDSGEGLLFFELQTSKYRQYTSVSNGSHIEQCSLSRPYFYCAFSIFRYTNTVVLQLSAVFGTVTCCVGLEQNRPYHLGLCKYKLIFTQEDSLTMHFLERIPIDKWYMSNLCEIYTFYFLFLIYWWWGKHSFQLFHFFTPQMIFTFFLKCTINALKTDHCHYSCT